MFSAFQSADFRRYFTGQCISLTGTWMQQATVSWMAYQMTQSPVVLGWVGFSQQLPTLLISPLAGALADRVSRRNGLLWTQVAGLLQASVLAILVFTHHLPLWALIGLAATLGVIQAIDNPMRQAYVPELFNHDKEKLGNAVAVNSATFNAARLFGPMVAGWLIVHVGSASSIALNAISYIAVIWALVGLPDRFIPKPATGKGVFSDVGEGFALAWRTPWMRLIFSLIMFSSLFIMPYTVLLPVVAVKTFNGGAMAYSNLMSAAGGGSLVGALWLASRQAYGVGIGRIVGGSGLMGLGLMAFSQTTIFWLALVCLFVTGFGWIVQMASCNMRLQQLATPENRGRVMSLYSFSFIGMAPFGSLSAGWLARHFGTEPTLLLSGVACLVASIVFYVQVTHIKDNPLPVAQAAELPLAAPWATNR
jgi:MFS family permease